MRPNSMWKHPERYPRRAVPAFGDAVRRVSALQMAVRRFFAPATPYLHRMLRRRDANLTLHLPDPETPRIPDLERLLNNLKRYGGNRISVVMNEHILPRLATDSSVFNVVLSRSTFASFRHKPPERMQ